MEIADVRIRIAKDGSDVPKSNVTPAEAIVQHVLRQNQNGGSTFGEEMDKIKIKGTAKTLETGKDGTPINRDRTDVEEMRRLQRVYGSLTNKKGTKIIRLLFPNVTDPKLPQTFKEINWKDILFDGEEISAFDYGTSGGAAISGGVGA